MRFRRARTEAMTRKVHEAGAIIHLTARGGLCIHIDPRFPGQSFEPSAESDQDDADWLIDLVSKLWPRGVPSCPSTKPTEGGDA